VTRAYIALGANLGDRRATLESAMNELSQIGTIVARSSIYETDPWGFDDQPPYLNAVAAIETEFSAGELLDALLAIEKRHGRIRTFQNAPRTLDLDLLLFGDQQLQTARLTVPHPRLHERAFVLVPLNDVAANVDVPGQDATVSELLDRLGVITGVRLFAIWNNPQDSRSEELE
jgi:2-amino-4-hydroxy-6-hydroxymethyldihydropteridine diphosphokinase